MTVHDREHYAEVTRRIADTNWPSFIRDNEFKDARRMHQNNYFIFFNGLNYIKSLKPMPPKGYELYEDFIANDGLIKFRLTLVPEG